MQKWAESLLRHSEHTTSNPFSSGYNLDVPSVPSLFLQTRGRRTIQMKQHKCFHSSANSTLALQWNTSCTGPRWHWSPEAVFSETSARCKQVQAFQGSNYGDQYRGSGMSRSRCQSNVQELLSQSQRFWDPRDLEWLIHLMCTDELYQAENKLVSCCCIIKWIIDIILVVFLIFPPLVVWL